MDSTEFCKFSGILLRSPSLKRLISAIVWLKEGMFLNLRLMDHVLCADMSLSYVGLCLFTLTTAACILDLLVRFMTTEVLRR